MEEGEGSGDWRGGEWDRVGKGRKRRGKEAKGGDTPGSCLHSPSPQYEILEKTYH